ncbi:MAG TPA: type II toxin-antitoxin system YafQ family toxin [Thermoanaerobaculia bacterium]|nr:type II toxin-antitoxin system YafQ family toxin [Thermoanaerobaculia bacterium]
MKRALVPSPAFLRAARKTLKKDPSLAENIVSTLVLLEEDAYDPRLRTHRLKGKLEGSWACSAGYDLRIIFSFVQQEDGETILLETLGTHDEVY